MRKRITPVQTILLGFILLILVGTILLSLPGAVRGSRPLSVLDACFTATSAVTTTGLVVVDTGTAFTVFGQTVILLLFQVGGLGYMLFVALAFFGISSGLTIGGRRLFSESVSRPSSLDARRFVRAVFLFTLFFECSGTLMLTAIFMERLPLHEALFSGLFHSVSAFCTAGFSLYSDSFSSYADSLSANAVIAFITIGGGVGFFVLYDLGRLAVRTALKRYPSRLTDHTRHVLVVTGSVWLFGMSALLLSGTGEAENGTSTRLLTTSFQVLSASTTTGFNSIAINAMPPVSLVCLLVLMFIGSSPGGTGGGIKTSNFGIMVLFVRSVLKNSPDVTAFRRTVPGESVRKALGIGLMASMYLVVLSLALFFSEDAPMLGLVFEAVSALGTVGLSTGVTPMLSIEGRVLIIVAMFIGRVGPLAVGYSLLGAGRTLTYRYPSGNVMVG